MPNWKKVIISGSDAALNSLEITTHLTASGLIYPTVDGTDGQALITDGSGNLTFNDLITYVTVKNVAAGTLEKGTPVHSTGTAGNSPEVIASSASLANTMPAGFVLAQDIAAGSEGRAILAGFLTGVDTLGLDEGANVYVGTNGGYTTTKPTGAANQIQNIAIVGNSATNGSIYIVGAGRSNDVPNLPTGKIWVGDGYTVTSSVVHLDETAEVFKVAGDAEITGSLTVTGTSEDIIIEDGSLKLGTSFTQITALAKTSLPSGEALSLRNGTVYITGAGQMGIGTSSPDAELHVNGSARVTDTLYFNADGKKGIKTNTDGLVIAGTSSIQFQSSDATIGNQTERMRITANGISGSVPFSGSFVGDGSGLTGVTAEWDGSHNGDAEITGSLVISGSSADLTVTGNVGIGTTTPAEKLTVEGRLELGEGTVNRSIQLRNDGLYISRTADGAYLSRVVGTSNGNQIDVAGQSAVNLKIATNIALRIATNRNIGIGTSAAAPGGRLHVKGPGTTSATNALLVENSSGTGLLTVRDDGNIGIGTSSPSEKLTVEGNISGSGNVNIVGDVTASAFVGDGSALTGITAEWDGSHNGDAEITGSLVISGSSADLTVTGNVGIGTTTPAQNLDVRGNAIIAGSTPSSPIGTSATLEVYENSEDSTLAIHQDDASATTKFAQIRLRNGGNDTYIKTPGTTHGLIVDTESVTDALTIHTAGNVGIGVAASTAKLHVKGSGTTDATTALLAQDSSGIELIKVYDDGITAFGDYTRGNGVQSDDYITTTGRVRAGGGITFRPPTVNDDTWYGFDYSSNFLNVRVGGTVAKFGKSGANTNDSFYVNSAFNPSSGTSNKSFIRIQAINQSAAGYSGNVYALKIESNITSKSGTGNDYGIFQNNSGVYNYFNGNVGIGNSTPTARLHISGSSTGDTVLIENNEGSSDAAPVVTLYRNSATPADGDYLGQLKFKGENDTGGEIVYAKITGKTSDVTNGTEDGLIETAVKKDGANVIVARQTGDALKLINGTGLEVDGTTTLGDLNLTDITVTGTASIAYLDVQFESASVIYSSGSNIFGDADDDVQTLNGDMVVNDTDLFVDASTSRVGITTNTPAHTLDVDSGDIRVSQSGKYLINNSNVGMYRSSNDLMLGGYGAIRFLSSATAITSQTERMVINSSGNVGIGTSSPASKLHVVGTSTSGLIRLTDTSGVARIASSNEAASAWEDLELKANDIFLSPQGGNVGIGTTSPLATTHIKGSNSGATAVADGTLIIEQGSAPSIQILSANTQTQTIKFGDPQDGDVGRIAYSHNTDDMTFYTGGSERMIISGSGNVGIGTDSPALQSGGTGLHLNATTSSELKFTNSTTGTGAADGTALVATGAGFTINNREAGSMSFGTSNSTRLRISSTGDVGIGTTSPSAKLDVEGDINVTNANISNQENTDIDTGTEVVATLEIATYTAGFFDFVIKKGTNVRSGTIYACHDGTSVVHTETTTIDLGDTSDVDLAVDISGGNMRLTATVASDDWSVKSLVRGL